MSTRSFTSDVHFIILPEQISQRKSNHAPPSSLREFPSSLSKHAQDGPDASGPRLSRLLRNVRSTSQLKARTSQFFPSMDTTPPTWDKGKLSAQVVTEYQYETSNLSIFGLKTEGNLIYQNVFRSGHSAQDVVHVQQLHPSILSGRHVLEISKGRDQTVLVSFEDEREASEWFVLLSALWQSRTGTRTRMRIDILDMEEIETESCTTSGRSLVDGLYKSTASTASTGENDATYPARTSKIHPGWAQKYHLAVELCLDGFRTMRMSWVRADKGSRPFWGTSFRLENLGPISNATLTIYCRHKKEIGHFANVPLSVVASCDTRQDQRYPVRSLDGSMIGEIRLSISLYQAAPKLEDRGVLELLLDMRLTPGWFLISKLGMLKETSCLVAGACLSEGLLARLVEVLLEQERVTSIQTIYRGNSIMSNLVQSTLMISCGHFLRAAIGPTIGKVLQIQAVRTEDEIADLVSECMAAMWSNRNLIPSFTCEILHAIKQRISLFENGDEGYWWKYIRVDSSLPLRGVAAFIILRLVNPALLQPQLYDLALGVPLSQSRRDLQAIAKAIHRAAFNLDQKAETPPILTDFLSHVSTEYRTLAVRHAATPIESFISARRTAVSEEERYHMMSLNEGVVFNGASDLAHLRWILKERIRVLDTSGMSEEVREIISRVVMI